MTLAAAKLLIHKHAVLGSQELQKLTDSMTLTQFAEFLTKRSPPLTSDQIREALLEFDKP